MRWPLLSPCRDSSLLASQKQPVRETGPCSPGLAPCWAPPHILYVVMDPSLCGVTGAGLPCFSLLTRGRQCVFGRASRVGFSRATVFPLCRWLTVPPACPSVWSLGAEAPWGAFPLHTPALILRPRCPSWGGVVPAAVVRCCHYLSDGQLARVWVVEPLSQPCVLCTLPCFPESSCSPPTPAVSEEPGFLPADNGVT